MNKGTYMNNINIYPEFVNNFSKKAALFSSFVVSDLSNPDSKQYIDMKNAEMGELADVSASTISRYLSKLRENGYIKYEGSGRGRLIYLTGNGLEVANKRGKDGKFVYTKLPGEIDRATTLNATDKILLSVIAKLANNGSAIRKGIIDQSKAYQCFAGNEYLSTQIGISETNRSTIARSLKRAEVSGFITISIKYDPKTGKRSRSIYPIFKLPDSETEAMEGCSCHSQKIKHSKSAEIAGGMRFQNPKRPYVPHADVAALRNPTYTVIDTDRSRRSQQTDPMTNFSIQQKKLMIQKRIDEIKKPGNTGCQSSSSKLNAHNSPEKMKHAMKVLQALLNRPPDR